MVHIYTLRQIYSTLFSFQQRKEHSYPSSTPPPPTAKSLENKRGEWWEIGCIQKHSMIGKGRVHEINTKMFHSKTSRNSRVSNYFCSPIHSKTTQIYRSGKKPSDKVILSLTKLNEMNYLMSICRYLYSKGLHTEICGSKAHWVADLISCQNQDFMHRWWPQKGACLPK